MSTAVIDRTRYAVFAIVISVTALSLGDAVVKSAGLSLPLWQIFVIRSAIIVLPVWWIARRAAPPIFRSVFWVAVRSVLLVLMWLSYYAGLQLMPLSLAAAIYYTGPLFVVGILAVTSRRWPGKWTAFLLLVGFAGVLFIVRPDTGGFDMAVFLPLAAAFFFASAMVLTSQKCRDEDPFSLVLAVNIAFIVSGGLLGLFSAQEGSLVLGALQPLTLELTAILVVLAGLFFVGSMCAAIAYQNGEPTTVAAFDYIYLILSVMWGTLFFSEVPNPSAIIGIVLIAGAGLLMISPRRVSK